MTKARDIASAAPAPSTVSATEIGYLDGVSSAIQTQLDGKQAANANVSTTELGYLDGVTSAIQTQLDAKVAKSLVDAKGDLLVGSANDTVSRLAVASTAGYVLTVDSAEATGVKWAAATGSSGPSFSASMGSTQTLTAATLTKLNFNTEQWDTDSCYDTTTYRFTPNKAGKYEVKAHVLMYDGPEYRLLIYKNGAEDCLLDIVDYTINDKNPVLKGSKMIDMNGSTDYLEIYGFMRANLTRRVETGASWFQATWIRS
jgi:hypothetical protein